MKLFDFLDSDTVEILETNRLLELAGLRKQTLENINLLEFKKHEYEVYIELANQIDGNTDHDHEPYYKLETWTKIFLADNEIEAIQEAYADLARNNIDHFYKRFGIDPDDPHPEDFGWHLESTDESNDYTRSPKVKGVYEISETKINESGKKDVKPYKLFLDDERDPPKEGEWVIARSVDEAIRIVKEKGFPVFISFDNDLGENVPEGWNFANWLIEYDLDTRTMPDGFDYYVHSQNPAARDAIKGKLDSYLKFKEKKIDENEDRLTGVVDAKALRAKGWERTMKKFPPGDFEYKDEIFEPIGFWKTPSEPHYMILERTGDREWLYLLPVRFFEFIQPFMHDDHVQEQISNFLDRVWNPPMRMKYDLVNEGEVIQSRFAKDTILNPFQLESNGWNRVMQEFPEESFKYNGNIFRSVGVWQRPNRHECRILEKIGDSRWFYILPTNVVSELANMHPIEAKNLLDGIWKEGKWIMRKDEIVNEKEIQYEIFFENPDHRGTGYAFNCDATGKVSNLSPKGEENYKKCLTGKINGILVLPGKIREIGRTIKESSTQKSLDEFLNQTWADEYINYPGLKIYLHIGQKTILGVDYKKVVDIINVSAQQAGKKTFTTFLDDLLAKSVEKGVQAIYIENITGPNSTRLVRFYRDYGFQEILNNSRICMYLLLAKIRTKPINTLKEVK